MKKVVVVSLLAMLLSGFSFAEKKPAVANPADFAINVHVVESRMSIDLVPCAQRLLTVIINQKKYEVWSPTKCTDGKGVLALGDYKAKLVKDVHPTAYQSLQIYQVILPDNTTMNFNIIGLIE